MGNDDVMGKLGIGCRKIEGYAMGHVNGGESRGVGGQQVGEGQKDSASIGSIFEDGNHQRSLRFGIDGLGKSRCGCKNALNGVNVSAMGGGM